MFSFILSDFFFLSFKSLTAVMAMRLYPFIIKREGSR
ncbi:unnamed protein product [Brugia timori]|uniref:Uncharacterized protein n=1 Tax=Brugia timori TaxID=42155 RepID=A0A0R3QV54_9BILA|nr:unnamed protein product [Brugia timori]